MSGLLTSQGRGALVCLKQSTQCAAYLHHRVEVLWSARSSLHSVRLTYITGERGSGLPEAVYAVCENCVLLVRAEKGHSGRVHTNQLSSLPIKKKINLKGS